MATRSLPTRLRGPDWRMGAATVVALSILAAGAAAHAAAVRSKPASAITFKRVGAAPVAGALARLRFRARLRPGRLIARHTVSFGDRTGLRRGAGRPLELRHTYARAGRYRVTLTLTDNRGRRTVGRVWVTVRRVPAGAPPPPPSPPAATPVSEAVTVPSHIASDCSTNVQQQLAALINAQPDGSTITFPAHGCYAQDDPITISDKRDLTIDANGSSFNNSAPNIGSKVAGNWLFVRGTNIRLTNARIVGNFHLTGARSQQRVVEATIGPGANTWNMGVGIYGGNGIYVTDSTIEHVFGDGVTVAVAQYVGGSPTDPLDTPRDIHVERVQVTKAARQCVAPTQADGFWLQDSTLADCWYGAFDGELDAASQTLKNLHILRNTLDGFFLFAIAIPVAGDANNTENIEIRDNTIKTRPDNACNPTIVVGTYPTNPNTIKNVAVTGNRLLARSGVGVAFDHVAGGSITDNTDGYVEAGCGREARPFATLTNFSAVTVANNVPAP